MVCMSVLSMPPHHYLLVVHEGSGAAVWDLRGQVTVAVLNTSGSGGDGDGVGSSRLAGVTTAAWLPGSSKGDFATGHDDGAVYVWEMPASAGGSSISVGNSNGNTSSLSKQAGLPGDMLQPHRQTLQAQLVSRLQGSGSSRATARHRPVKSLEFVAGAVECVVVFGGNEFDRPDGLTLLPLPEPSQVSCSRPSVLHFAASRSRDPVLYVRTQCL